MKSSRKIIWGAEVCTLTTLGTLSPPIPSTRKGSLIQAILRAPTLPEPLIGPPSEVNAVKDRVPTVSRVLDGPGKTNPNVHHNFVRNPPIFTSGSQTSSVGDRFLVTTAWEGINQDRFAHLFDRRGLFLSPVSRSEGLTDGIKASDVPFVHLRSYQPLTVQGVDDLS